MKNNATKKMSKIVNWASALLMLVMLVTLFLPNWTYQADGEACEASIAKYVFLPTYNPEIQKSFESQLNTDIEINSEVGYPVLVFVAAAFAVILQVLTLKSKKVSFAPSLLAVLGGVGGLYGWLTSDVMKLGALYIPQVAISAVALVVGLVGVFYLVQTLREKEATRFVG